MSLCVKIFSSVTLYKLFVFSFTASFSNIIFQTELFIHDLMPISSYICCITWESRLQGEILLKPASALVQFVKQDLFSQHKHIMQLFQSHPSSSSTIHPCARACATKRLLPKFTPRHRHHSPLSTLHRLTLHLPASSCTFLCPQETPQISMTTGKTVEDTGYCRQLTVQC